jgi:hypothetical protein
MFLTRCSQTRFRYFTNTVPSPAAAIRESLWNLMRHGHDQGNCNSLHRYTLFLQTDEGQKLPWLYIRWDPIEEAYQTYTARMMPAGSPVLFVTGTILYKFTEPYKYPQADLNVAEFRKTVFKEGDTGEVLRSTEMMSPDIDCLDTYLDNEGRCTIVHSAKNFAKTIDRLDLGCGHQFLTSSKTGNIRKEPDGIGYATRLLPADCKLVFEGTRT